MSSVKYVTSIKIMGTQMVRTIGGEFELDPTLLESSERDLFYSGTYFSSGRAALCAILRKLQEEHSDFVVMLPSYLCQSIIKTLNDLRLPFAFYGLTRDLQIDRDDVERIARQEKTSKLVFLVISYFGLVDCGRDVGFIQGLAQNPLVIQDNVQAFFDMDRGRKADFSFTSFRKTLPVPDGALVETAQSLASPTGSEFNAFSYYKTIGALIKHQAVIDGADDNTYLDFLRLGEEELDRNGFYDARMSRCSFRVLGNLDLKAVSKRRVSNFEYLRDRLRSIGLIPLIDLGADRVPLFFPIVIRERDRIRRALAEDSVFCPVHWPLPRQEREKLENSTFLYNNELSLVIDQRYDHRHMEIIAAKLESLDVEMFDNR